MTNPGNSLESKAGAKTCLWPTRQQWKRWSLPSKLTFLGAWVGFVSLALVLLAVVINQANAWFADPRPSVSVKVSQSEIYIQMRTRSPTNSITIDFPVLGRIVKVHDYNTAADVVTVSKAIIGHNVVSSQNNLEIVLADVKPNRDVDFKILYEPMSPKMKVAGTDRWQMSYSWLYGGATITKTKWYLIANGKEVGPPAVSVRGTIFIPRALSPEERKKLYEEGPPRTELK